MLRFVKIKHGHIVNSNFYLVSNDYPKMRQITCYMEFRLIIVSHAVKWFSELINSSIIWHNGTNWECETSFNACTYICANILFWSNESSKNENKKLNCMIQILESTASSNKPCWLWYVVIKYAEKWNSAIFLLFLLPESNPIVKRYTSHLISKSNWIKYMIVFFYTFHIFYWIV